MKKHLHKILFIISAVAILGGLAALLPYAYFWNQNRIAAASVIEIPIQAELPPAPDLITGKPTHLSVPSLDLELAIADGIYNESSKTWSLSKDKAHYALATVQPNNKQGNTFIYGHYRPEVFARLKKITVGSEVTITTDNGHRFTYIYRETQTVDPSNVDILAYQGVPQLTIQTCSGAWMQNRQLYFFDFARVE